MLDSESYELKWLKEKLIHAAAKDKAIMHLPKINAF